MKVNTSKLSSTTKQPVSILKKRPPPQESPQKQTKSKKKMPKTIIQEMQDEESDIKAEDLFDQNQQDEQIDQNQRSEQVVIKQQNQVQKQKQKLERILEQIRKQKAEKGQKKSAPKRKGITINQGLNVQYDMDKKWDTKIQNQKKGAFTQEEQNILYSSICKYALEYNLTLQEIQEQILYNVNPSKKQAMWTTICSVLPRRSINSCFKFLKRKLDPKNHHGHWTEEEVEQLKLLVDQYHTKWTIISKQLNRTPQNIRDKYRSLGQQRAQQRSISFWKMQQLIIFLKQIQKNIGIRFLKKEYKKLTDLNLHDNYELKQRDTRQSKSRQRNSQYFLFHNLSTILTFVNFSKLNKYLQHQVQIDWTSVAKQIPTKSKDDCKNKWKQIKSIVITKQNYFSNQQDQKLINQIGQQNPQNQYEIDFEKIDNEHTAKANKLRWNILKKFVNGRISRSLTDILKELKKKNELRNQNPQLLPDTEQNKILKMFMQMKEIQEKVREDKMKKEEQQ